MFIIHSYNYLSCTAESTCIHTNIHLTCSPFTLTENMVAEVKMDKSTYLMMNLIYNQLRRCNIPPNRRPACSLISQQRFHPRARHDSPRNKGTSRLTHRQGYTKQRQANTVGFIRPSRSGKGSMLSWWAHYRGKNTYTRTSLTSKTPKHTQHKESVPSLLHSPLGPASASSAIQGWWRRRSAL